MGRFSDLLIILEEKGLDTSFEKLDTNNIQREKNENPNLPVEYIEFLEDVGYGDVGKNGFFMFYSGLIPAGDIYGEVSNESIKNSLLFGDDFNGYCVGFLDRNNWEMIEIDESQRITHLNSSFEEFARNKIMEYITNVIGK